MKRLHELKASMLFGINVTWITEILHRYSAKKPRTTCIEGTIPTLSHTFLLSQCPQRKELFAVTEHTAMMDVVTLYITKDHPSQFTGFVGRGSRMTKHETQRS